MATHTNLIINVELELFVPLWFQGFINGLAFICVLPQPGKHTSESVLEYYIVDKVKSFNCTK